jgi:transposase-like protein
MPLNLTPQQLLAVQYKAGGETRAQVARRLGVSRQAVKKLWARARVRALADMDERRRRKFVAALGMSAKPETVRPTSLSA